MIKLYEVIDVDISPVLQFQIFGANTDPCGTPESKRIVLLRVVPSLIFMVLLYSQDLKNLMKIAGKPSFMALCGTPVCQTLSNAFFASNSVSIAIFGCFDLIALVYMLIPFLNPVCTGIRPLFILGLQEEGSFAGLPFLIREL